MSDGQVNALEALATLTGKVSAAATSLEVSKAAPEALRGKTFRVLIDRELMLVTATAAEGASPWTVERNVESVVGGSGAGEHAAGAEIRQMLTAASVAAKADLEGEYLKDSQLSPSVVRSSASTIGNGSATTFTVTHSLESEDVTVSCVNLTTKEVVVPGVKVLSTSQVEVTFSVAPETNSRRIIVQRSI